MFHLFPQHTSTLVCLRYRRRPQVEGGQAVSTTDEKSVWSLTSPGWVTGLTPEVNQCHNTVPNRKRKSLKNCCCWRSCLNWFCLNCVLHIGVLIVTTFHIVFLFYSISLIKLICVQNQKISISDSMLIMILDTGTLGIRIVVFWIKIYTVHRLYGWIMT